MANRMEACRLGHMYGGIIAALLVFGSPFALPVSRGAAAETPPLPDLASSNTVSPDPAYLGRDAGVFPKVRHVPPGVVLAHEIDRLIDQVVALTDRYGWRWSQTGSMIASLEEVFIDLDQGEAELAAREMSDFSVRIGNQLEAGNMPRDAGVPLLRDAEEILLRLQFLARVQRLEKLAAPPGTPP